MRNLLERVVVMLTLSFVAVLVAQTAAQTAGAPEASTVLLAGIVAFALGALLAARFASALARTTRVGVGERAREHRQQLAAEPAPRHPNTEGRPRTRAPSLSLPVA